LETNEQRFKRRAKQILKEKGLWTDMSKDKMGSVLDDVWDWFDETGHHGNMTEPVWTKILKKNGVTIKK